MVVRVKNIQAVDMLAHVHEKEVVEFTYQRKIGHLKYIYTRALFNLERPC